MGLLTFSINVTLDGCVDHQEGIADDETHAFFTRLMDEVGAMLWSRVTYEMMESYWPAVARGDAQARDEAQAIANAVSEFFMGFLFERDLWYPSYMPQRDRPFAMRNAHVNLQTLRSTLR